MSVIILLRLLSPDDNRRPLSICTEAGGNCSTEKAIALDERLHLHVNEHIIFSGLKMD